MDVLLERLVNSDETEVIQFVRNNIDLLEQEIEIDCSTLTNHCVCASNLEYFRNPSHVIQCFRKKRCFHCERYRHMQRQYESVTARISVFLAAAALGKLKLFKYMHTNGCDLESKTAIFQLRPLHLAIVNGHFELFLYLLSHHVDVNAPLCSHDTTFSPIMAAVKHGRVEMVPHLVMISGLNLTFRNSLQQTALLFAVQENNLELINVLVAAEEALLNRPFRGGERSLPREIHHPCALLEAVKQDNDAVLSLLLKNGCPVNYVFNGYHGQTTATVIAAVCNARSCLQILLDHGADLEPEVDGFTPLEWTTFLNWSDCVQILQVAKFKQLESVFESHPGSYLNKTEESDSSSLNSSSVSDISDEMDAAVLVKSHRRHEPLVEVWSLVQWLDVCDVISRLVALGHHVDTQDEFGRTSLHLAVEEQNVPGARRLIELGANTEATDVCLATPLWHAVYWNKESMVKELLFANVVLECSAVEDAYRIGLPWHDVTDAQHNGDADHPSAKVFRTILYLAVKRNFYKLVVLLLETGYDTSRDNMNALVTMAKEPTRSVLLDHLSQPRSLFTTARNRIRKWLGKKIHQMVQECDLPQRVKDCLLIRDIMELRIEPSLKHL